MYVGDYVGKNVPFCIFLYVSPYSPSPALQKLQLHSTESTVFDFVCMYNVLGLSRQIHLGTFFSYSGISALCAVCNNF